MFLPQVCLKLKVPVLGLERARSPAAAMPGRPPARRCLAPCRSEGPGAERRGGSSLSHSPSLAPRAQACTAPSGTEQGIAPPGRSKTRCRRSTRSSQQPSLAVPFHPLGWLGPCLSQHRRDKSLGTAPRESVARSLARRQQVLYQMAATQPNIKEASKPKDSEPKPLHLMYTILAHNQEGKLFTDMLFSARNPPTLGSATPTPISLLLVSKDLPLRDV